MAQYLPLPDGSFLTVREGETPDQAWARGIQEYPTAFGLGEETAEAPQEPGFVSGFKAGLEGLKGGIGAIGAAAGIEGAEEYAAQKRAEAAKYATPEFSEDPLGYVTSLLGSSAAYMMAPIAAGAAVAATPLTGTAATLAALGAAGAASATQFTGENLQRQFEQGKRAENLEVGKAVAAAVPQAALDVVSLRLFPGLGRLFGRMGVDVTEEQGMRAARRLAEASGMGMVKQVGVQGLKTAGVEGLTESAQAVLSRMQADLELMSPEARQEYIDNFIGGATLGSIFAVPGTFVQRGRARQAVEEADTATAQRAAQEEEQTRLAAEDPQVVFLRSLGVTDADIFGTEEEAAAAGVKEADSTESWLSQWLEAKPKETTEIIGSKLDELFQFTRAPGATTREEAIEIIMTRPELAAQVAQSNESIPFLNRTDSAAVRSAIKAQLKARAKAVDTEIKGRMEGARVAGPAAMAEEEEATVAQEQARATDEEIAANARRMAATAKVVQEQQALGRMAERERASAFIRDFDERQAAARPSAPSPTGRVISGAGGTGEGGRTAIRADLLPEQLQKRIAQSGFAKGAIDQNIATRLYNKQTEALEAFGQRVVDLGDTPNKGLARKTASDTRKQYTIDMFNEVDARRVSAGLPQLKGKEKADAVEALTGLFNKYAQQGTAIEENKFLGNVQAIRANLLGEAGAAPEPVTMEEEAPVMRPGRTISEALGRRRAVVPPPEDFQLGDRPRTARETAPVDEEVALAREQVLRDDTQQRPLFPEEQAKLVTERTTPERFQRMLESKEVAKKREQAAQEKDPIRKINALKDSRKTLLGSMSGMSVPERKATLKRLAAIDKQINAATQAKRAAAALKSKNEEVRKQGLREIEAGVNATIERAQSPGAWDEFVRVERDTSSPEIRKKMLALARAVGSFEAQANALAPDLRDAMNTLKKMGVVKMEDMVRAETNAYQKAADEVTAIKSKLDSIHKGREKTVNELDTIYQKAPKVVTTKTGADAEVSVKNPFNQELLKTYKAAIARSDRTLQERAEMEAALGRRRKAPVVRSTSGAPGAFRTGTQESKEGATRTSTFPKPLPGREAPSKRAVTKKEMADADKIADTLFDQQQRAAKIEANKANEEAAALRREKEDQRNAEVLFAELVQKRRELTRKLNRGDIDAKDYEKEYGRLTKLQQSLRTKSGGAIAKSVRIAENNAFKIDDPGALVAGRIIQAEARSIDKKIKGINAEITYLGNQLNNKKIDVQEFDTKLKLLVDKKTALINAGRAAVKELEEEGKPLNAEALKDLDSAHLDDNAAPRIMESTVYDAPSMTDIKVNVRNDLNKGDLLGALSKLGKNGSTPFVRTLAGILSDPVLMGNVRVRLVSDLEVKGKRSAGAYNPSNRTISIDYEAMTEETLLHEAVHAVTLRNITRDEAELTQVQKAARNELQAMFKQLSKDPAFKNEYGSFSLEEFVSEVMSNKVLQDKLSTQKWFGGDMMSRFIARAIELIKQVYSRLTGRELRAPLTMNRAAAQEAFKLFEPAEVFDYDPVSSVMRGIFPGTAPVPSIDIPSDVQAAVTSGITKGKGLIDQVLANVTGLNFRTQFIDRFAPIEELLRMGVARNKLESMQAFQTMYYLRFGEQRNQYVQQAASVGPVRRIKQEDGTFTIEAEDGANLGKLAEILRSANVGNEASAEMMFTKWMAGRRASQPGVGFDKLNVKKPDEFRQDYEKINRFINSNEQIKKTFNEAKDVYNEYNRGLINFAVDAGAISKEEGARLNKMEYIPFYREVDGEVKLVIAGEKPIRIGDIKNQPYLRELVGGDEDIRPVFSSALQNTSMLVDMALRNIQTKDVAYILKQMDGAEIRQGNGQANANTIRFKQDGKPMHAVIDTKTYGVPADLLVKGMEGIKTVIPGIVRALSIPAQVLRKGVTRFPAYALRQAVRDPINAWFVTGGNFAPVASSFKELSKMVAGKSNIEEVLQKAGAISSNVFTGDKEDTARILRDLSKGGGAWGRVMAKADAFAIQGDSATRAVLYNMYRERGMTHMQALLGSLESMNFSRKGVSPSMQFMSMMVPFFNAQIQGLDVIYRAARGKSVFEKEMDVKAMLIKRGILMAAGTMAYAAAMQDDETYKNATPQERAQYWFVPIPGVEGALRVPIPFELGYAFKSIPEMVYNVALGDQKASEAMKALGGLAYQTVPIGLPQGFKPIVEVAANYSFFTGSPIEYQRMLGLQKTERFGPNTTELAKLLSSAGLGAVGLSPAQIDYLIRGYTGSMGITIAQMPNIVLRPLTGDDIERPAKKLNEYPLIGSLIQPKDGRGIINSAYERMDEIQQASATYKKMLEEGRRADAQAFAFRYADELAAVSMAGTFRRQMGDLARIVRNIQASQTLTADQKREKIDAVRQIQQKLAERMRGA